MTSIDNLLQALLVAPTSGWNSAGRVFAAEERDRNGRNRQNLSIQEYLKTNSA